MKQCDNFIFPKLYREIAEEYIYHKQSLGFKYGYKEQEKINTMLNYIYSHSKSNPVLKFTNEVAHGYADKKNNEKPRTVHDRQSKIRQFALFLNNRGIKAYVYSDKLIKIPKDFTPYIFTKEEIYALLKEADSIQPNKNKFMNTPLVHPAIIRVLYGCGTRVGETVNLLISEVDLDNGIITIHNGKNNVSRLVPMSDSLVGYLRKYNSLVERKTNPYFFPARHNEHYAPVTIRKVFIKLMKQAGIGRLCTGQYPRTHDVRHTFSVHSLEQMIEKGMDPYCSLPALSTYLGHKGIESTEIYLRLTKQYYLAVLQCSQKNADRIFPGVENL